tara:strand:+ start:52 stop:864 length:813 start_codon:yes stop_codon:yes gene_type:complete
MNSNDERYRSTIGLTDLLFNILVGFAFLFIVAFLLIKPEAKKKDFDRRAEFIVVLEWDAGAKDDIDLYVEDPLGGVASFRHPAVNFSHLDKDDLGSRNDTTKLPDGTTQTIRINREVMTIRGLIAGEWIANAHYYSAYAYGNKNPPDYFITVKIELHKVNPYKILWIGEKKFTHKGQEETFLRWRIDSKGKILPPFTFQSKDFVLPGQVGSTDVENNSRALTYFSQMNVHFESSEDEDGEESVQPIAGPMEGFNDHTHDQKFLDRELGGP